MITTLSWHTPTLSLRVLCGCSVHFHDRVGIIFLSGMLGLVWGSSRRLLVPYVIPRPFVPRYIFILLFIQSKALDQQNNNKIIKMCWFITFPIFQVGQDRIRDRQSLILRSSAPKNLCRSCHYTVTTYVISTAIIETQSKCTFNHRLQPQI